MPGMVETSSAAAASPNPMKAAAAAAGSTKSKYQKEVDDLVVVFNNQKGDKAVRVKAIEEIVHLCNCADPEPFEPYLVKDALPALLDAVSDKQRDVQKAAEPAIDAVRGLICPHAVAFATNVLLKAACGGGKWQTKASALKVLKEMATTHPTQLSRCMPVIVPVVQELIWDTKPEVSQAAKDVMKEALDAIDNKDLEPFVPKLMGAMTNPEEVPECIHALAATTFVQTVDSASLSIIVPLLLRGLALRPVAIKRQCAVIVENMSKLVEEAIEAAPFTGTLLPALARCKEEVSDPEARAVAGRAHDHMARIAEKVEKALLVQTSNEKGVEKAIQEMIAGVGGVVTPENEESIHYLSSVIRSLIKDRNFEEAEWKTHLTPYLYVFCDQPESAAVAAVDLLEKCKVNTVDVNAKEEEDEEGEDLCNCKFSLAYGSKILLHNTELRLKRGKRYGLLGPNDSGKTTLMRAISNEQVDGFPPRSEVHTVFVEADIQGEMSHLCCIDYILADESIKACGATKEDVARVMESVGFTPQMQNNGVTTLSGGWRMKLALARAMIQKADILLLDEPTNHLDVINVAWVQNYLNSLTNVTCIMVSHDSGLLDKCCTHILQIENLKLHVHKGNLSAFVAKVPSAKSYFEIKPTKYTMNFPQPGYLEGVKNKSKVLMKMTDVTFTYPGNDKPTISNITVAVSLSSRVACVGVNGAGKSTMIKLLTGQLEPSSGEVWKFPNTRVAYLAQHAFHHIEQHLTKTPNEYIQWRYAGGQDKEGLDKVTLKISEEEEKALKKEFIISYDDEKGNLKKEKRIILRLAGGRKESGKKGEFEYEVQFENLPHDKNLFVKASDLEERGYSKHMKIVDAKVEAGQFGFGRALTKANVEKHLEDVGLEKEYATHHRIAALSGGQKVKVVLAAAMWMQPHILILDEPTNYLDRDALGALSGAIREFGGGVVMITHNNDFCSQLCPETWVLENGLLNCKGDVAWMSKQVEKVEFNTKKLSNKEKKAREKRRAFAKANGLPLSDSEEDD
eukprot:jgi/Mesvir1/25022/Mv16966-RA.8